MARTEAGPGGRVEEDQVEQRSLRKRAHLVLCMFDTCPLIASCPHHKIYSWGTIFSKLNICSIPIARSIPKKPSDLAVFSPQGVTYLFFQWRKHIEALTYHIRMKGWRHILVFQSFLETCHIDSLTEPRTTETTEPRKTQPRKTQVQKSEPLIRPNLEFGPTLKFRTLNDWTSKSPNIENDCITSMSLEWSNLEKFKFLNYEFESQMGHCQLFLKL